MNTNLEKIVAILDLLMFRVRRLKKPYETMTGMDETTHTIIIKTFDRLLNGISQIREQFENGSQPVPDEHAEAAALALVLYSVQYGEKVIGESELAATDKANALTIIRMAEKEIEKLKQERNLVDVEITESERDFPPPDFSDPGMIPDPHTCMAKVEENEELAAQARVCGRDDLAEQYESVAARWRYLYEEAEDEEMEW